MKRFIEGVKTQLFKLATDPRKRFLLIIAFVAIFAIFFVAVDPAMAADESTDDFDFMTWLMTQMAQWLLNITQIIGQVIVALVGVLVQIIQYNGFSNSQVIGLGWALVRDTLNIGFIAVLILVALGTIVFGESGAGGRFNWRKNLPNIVIFAILINFSRLFCGIMIDISNVIMLTFVNGIKDIAGGNIIQLFGLSSIMSFSEKSVQASIDAGTGLTAFSMLAASLLALLMMSIVLLTMITMIAMLGARIVILWVLVVLSPAAFFAGAAKNVLQGQAMKVYSDWWANFTGALAVGPILVFVLWLALAVAGSGSIASEFAVDGGTEADAFVSDIPNQVFERDNLISFIIGILIMFVGFDIAVKTASALPGGFKSLVGPGLAARALRTAAVTTARVGYRGARGAAGLGVGAAAGALRKGGQAARWGAGLAGGALAENIRLKPPTYDAKTGKLKEGEKEVRVKDIKAYAADQLKAAGMRGIAKGVPGAGYVTQYAAEVGAADRGKKAALLNNAIDKQKVMGKDELLAIASNPNPAMSAEENARRQAARYQLLTQFKHRKDLDSNQVKALKTDFNEGGGKELIEGDENKKEAMLKAGHKRLDMFKGDWRDPDSDLGKAITGLEGKDFKDLDSQALQDPRIQEMLKEKQMFVKSENRDIPVWDALKRVGKEAHKREIASVESGGQNYEDLAKAMGQQQVNLQAKIEQSPAGERAQLREEMARMRTAQAGATQDFIERNPAFLSQAKATDLAAGGGVLAQNVAVSGTPRQIRDATASDEKRTEFLSQTSEDRMRGLGYTDDQVFEARAGRFIASGSSDDLGPSAERGAVIQRVVERGGPKEVNNLIQVANSQEGAAAQEAARIEVAESFDKSKVESILNDFETATGEQKEQLRQNLSGLKETFSQIRDVNMTGEMQEIKKMLELKDYKYEG